MTALISFAEVLTYGSLCERVGKTYAFAVVAQKLGRKKQARQWWRAYYDATRAKERLVRQWTGAHKPRKRG